MTKNTLLLLLTLPLISGCGLVRTAVNIVTTPIDLLTLQEQDNADDTIQIAQQQQQQK